MLLKMCTLALLVSLLAVPSLQEVAQVSSLASANNQFGRSLMDQLTPSYENVVISPYSLHAVLSMTALGARGDTLTEMETALHTSGLTDVHQAYGQLVQSFNDTGNVDVLTANGLFQNPNYTIGSEFKDTAVTSFDAAVEELDFASPEGPEAMINGWVEQQTNDQIKGLITPGTLHEVATKLVLVNTLFFNASWKIQFASSQTKNTDFFLTNTETETVEMMTSTDDFEIKLNNKYQALRLPFEGNRFAMYFVVPTDSSDIIGRPDCIPHSFPDYLFDFTRLDKMRVSIYVPKFEINFRHSFVENLIAMGMTKAFSASADLSGISADTMISDVVQQGVIKVTESGTTAVAASYVVMTRSMASNEDVYHFRVNKPFLFFLRDDEYEEILFQGKYSRPSLDPSQFVNATHDIPRCEVVDENDMDGNGASRQDSTFVTSLLAVLTFTFMDRL